MPTDTENLTRSALRGRFEALDGKIVARLNEISRPVDLAAGLQIIIEGDPAASIYSMRQGIASVFKLLPDGRRQITGFLYPGDFLGVTFNLGAVYGYGAETVTRCSLRAWPRAALERLLEEASGLRRLFLAEIADELTKAQDRMLMLARRSVEERVATFMLNMARRQNGAKGTRVEVIEIPMRWSDIADYLGTSAESVSRALAKFRGRRIIRTDKRGEIWILDWAALETLAAAGRPERGEIYR